PHFSHIQPQDTRSRLLRRLAKKDQALVARIAKEPKLRRELGEKMLQKIPEILTAYDVTRVATHIRAPVLLLHGAGDAVVPEQESRELYPLLPNARLVVSPLLEHADPKISLRLVREVWRLVSAMAWYFRHADR
ncbi:MAG: alpha/beta hydrolase, partial [Turneriella sp.]|nr:alpha/beta hydrolase [Turneriella sp.]